MLAPSARSVLVTVTATVFTLASLILGSSPVTFAADGDLVMTLVSGPSSASKGGQIVILNRVMNQGSVDTTSQFTVGLYLSTDAVIDPSTDIFLGSRIVPCCLTTIGIRRVSQVNTKVTIPSSVPPGTYYLGAYADIPPPNGVLAEDDESNNALAGNSITIDSSSGGGGDGGGCGRITFWDDDHPNSGTITGDFLVLFSMLIFLYVKRHWRPWSKDGTNSYM
jgi:CARDB